MIKVGVFGLFFSLSLAAHGFDLGVAVGDYKIELCAGLASHTTINYCRYDELAITQSLAHPNLINFEFFTKGRSALSFTVDQSVDPSNSAANRLSLGSDSKEIILDSEEQNSKSMITFENLPEGPLVTFFSQSEGQIFEYDLRLKKKSN